MSKQPWTIDQWRAYGKRCQAVRDRLTVLIHSIPPTRGLTVSHWNGLIKVHDCLVAAMTELETLLIRQHPEFERPPEINGIRIIHGESFKTWFHARGGTKRNAPPLPPERWVEIGREVKAIRKEFFALMLELQGTQGATKERVKRFGHTIRALDQGKCKLEDLLYHQYPDWDQGTHVFYGPNDPAIIPQLEETSS